MRHRKKVIKLGRKKSHRKALFSNLLASLVKHGRIKTTPAKAKELRRLADKIITLGKKGDLHSLRLAITRLGGDKEAASKVFNELAKGFSNRNSGYTRITKLATRGRGDGREYCFIEYLDSDSPPSTKEKEKSKEEKSLKTPS